MASYGSASYPGPLTVRAPAVHQHLDASSEGSCSGSLRSQGMQVAAVRLSSAKESAGVPASPGLRVSRLNGLRARPAPTAGELQSKGADKVPGRGGSPSGTGGSKQVEQRSHKSPFSEDSKRAAAGGPRPTASRLPVASTAPPREGRSQSRERTRAARPGSAEEVRAAPARASSLNSRRQEESSRRGVPIGSAGGSVSTQPGCEAAENTPGRWPNGESDASFEGPLLRDEAYLRSPSPAHADSIDSVPPVKPEARGAKPMLRAARPTAASSGMATTSRLGRAGPQQAEAPRSLSRDGSTSRNGSRSNLDRNASPGRRAKSPGGSVEPKRASRPASARVERPSARRASSAEPRVLDRGARDAQNRSVPRTRPTSQNTRTTTNTTPLRRGSGSASGSSSAGSLLSGSLKLRSGSSATALKKVAGAADLNQSGTESPGLGRPQFQDQRDIQPSPNRRAGRPLGARGVVVPPLAMHQRKQPDGACRVQAAPSLQRPEQACGSGSGAPQWHATQPSYTHHVVMTPASWQEEASVAAGPTLVGDASMKSTSPEGSLGHMDSPGSTALSHGGDIVWHGPPAIYAGEAEIWGGINSKREEPQTLSGERRPPPAGWLPEIRPPPGEAALYENTWSEGLHAPRGMMPPPDTEKSRGSDKGLHHNGHTTLGSLRHAWSTEPVLQETLVYDEFAMESPPRNENIMELNHPLVGHPTSICDGGIQAVEVSTAITPNYEDAIECEVVSSIASPSVTRSAAENGLGQETTSILRCSSPLSPIHEVGEPGAPSPNQDIRTRLEHRFQDKVCGGDGLSVADHGGGCPREGGGFEPARGNIGLVKETYAYPDCLSNPQKPLPAAPASSRERYWQIRERFLAQ